VVFEILTVEVSRHRFFAISDRKNGLCSPGSIGMEKALRQNWHASLPIHMPSQLGLSLQRLLPYHRSGGS
jgi:hypothetical protein